VEGWISLHRKIWDNWTWKDKPFSKGQAWIDLILMVNHQDQKVVIGNELILVERGSRITSIRQLCNRWGWSNTKVVAFLKLLEKDGMLHYKSDTKKTVVSIVNYSDYQDTKKEKTTEKRQKNDTETTQKHTNNNVNNDLIKNIVSYLNEKAGKKYQPSTDKTITLINARLKEGYDLEDFKRVIDVKVSSWKNTDMEKYLRPATLFNGEKFEGYLNEGTAIKQDIPRYTIGSDRLL